MSARGGVPKAFVVLDLGFGDAGKGLVTDYLVRRQRAELVVRFNGGAQAGHNVVTRSGLHHTFAQFGAGTLAGARTLLSEHVLVHPTALLREAAALARLGIPAPLFRIRIHEAARLITPFHQAANRLRELARGEERHGSCGVGVGETVRDSLEHPGETLRAGDLLEPTSLRKKLRRVQDRKREELRQVSGTCGRGPQAAQEWRILEEDHVADTWIELVAELARSQVVAPDAGVREWMRKASACIFEGAQGVLLDEVFGFHPYTTWSCCTDQHARELLHRMLPEVEPTVVGVLRSHVVRHGPGPLPTETEELRRHVQDHNRANAWQGQVRYGWFDCVLARYALEVAGRVDSLVLTHLDVLDRAETWRVSSAYRSGSGAAPISALPVHRSPDVAVQARLTALLSSITPINSDVPAQETAFLREIETLLGREVSTVSRGPSAGDVARRSPGRW